MLNSRFSSSPLHAPIATNDALFVASSIDCVGTLLTGILMDIKTNNLDSAELYRSLDTSCRLLGAALGTMHENGIKTENINESLKCVTNYMNASKGK
jgi:hypothetical protein